jgi:hypothetical protein
MLNSGQEFDHGSSKGNRKEKYSLLLLVHLIKETGRGFETL